MSDILNRIKSGAGKVAKEADKAVDIKRIEMQVASINKEVEEEYQKLGQLVYENNLLDSEEEDTSSLIAHIGDLLSQIEEKRKEIEKIKQDTEEPSSVPATAVDKKYCSECGAQNNASNKFCASCGAKMQ